MPTDTPLAQCAECGHLHWDGRLARYVACPLRDDGCRCPYRDGDGEEPEEPVDWGDGYGEVYEEPPHYYTATD